MYCSFIAVLIRALANVNNNFDVTVPVAVESCNDETEPPPCISTSKQQSLALNIFLCKYYDLSLSLSRFCQFQFSCFQISCGTALKFHEGIVFRCHGDCSQVS